MKPNLPALRRLVKILRQPLPFKIDRFNMGCWKDTACGTSACACGLAASHPWFIKRGLRLTQLYAGSSLFTLSYRSHSGFRAASRFFGVDNSNHYPFKLSETEKLFSPEAYKRGKREDVARRLEAFIRKHE